MPKTFLGTSQGEAAPERQKGLVPKILSFYTRPRFSGGDNDAAAQTGFARCDAAEIEFLRLVGEITKSVTGKAQGP